jgi:type VI secretion system protein ImpJ
MKPNSSQTYEVLPAYPAQRDGVAALSWFEGMQLLPQHFQYSDRRIDYLLQRYASGCFAHYWGLDSLSFDPVSLAAGTLRITQAFGQFEDGLVFSYQTQPQAALEFDFSSFKSEMPLRLALAVPVGDFDSSAGLVTRHRQYYGAPMANSANLDEKASIARLQPQMAIQIWRPERADYVQLPVIEIRAAAQGFEVAHYHPPAVRVMAQSALEKTISDVSQALRRAAEFVRGHAVPERLSAGYSNGHGWILSCLVGGLSSLEAQVASRVAHPYDLYLALCGIAGQVAAVGGTIPPHFPSYDHFDPAAAINVVAGFILNVIPGLAPVQELTLDIPFEQQPTRGTWCVVMPTPFASRSVTLRIKLTQGDAAMALSEWIDGALICYASQMGRCRELRISGLPRKLVETVPAMGLKSDARHFLLRIDGLDAAASGESMVIEFAQDAAKKMIDRISLVIPNV